VEKLGIFFKRKQLDNRFHFIKLIIEGVRVFAQGQTVFDKGDQSSCPVMSTWIWIKIKFIRNCSPLIKNGKKIFPFLIGLNCVIINS